MSEEKKVTNDQPLFKDTLNLPRTDFPIRAQSSIDDPAMIMRWEEEKLYEKATHHNEGKKKFILHDGPPYANGHIHLGTAYNKILKDIFAKSQRMAGFHVPVTPGWDCHGLPIEFKVTQENPSLEPSALKKACRIFAQQWIEIQRKEFKELGVLMDWDNPYKTMDFKYEAKVVRAFGILVEQGYISRKNKTVPWCFSCKTVLATAEIEYQDRKDPSIYVLFGLNKETIKKAFNIDKPVSLLVWTTTPWTLPLNRAVTLKPGASYDILLLKGQYVVVGSLLADAICSKVGEQKNVIATCKAEALKGALVLHPFIDNFEVPILLDQFVGLSDGTAAVHTAPGCGADDYDVALKNGIEIFSPLSESGTYTKGIMPQELEGKTILDGQRWVFTALLEKNTLFHKESINHSYPHCWRCRNGLMFRATKQWFCDLSHNKLRELAVDAVEHKIDFIPEGTRNHLRATLEGRLEWCLSRQRVWGTPIPVFYCAVCNEPYFNRSIIEKVADGIEQSGIEYWDTVLAKDILAADVACLACGEKSFVKEQDILDVWFDAGVSHYAVLSPDKNLQYPADLYVEGIDQHRGWFQSSLLTSMAINGNPCMKTIVTHGYTVDEKGRKMSKSLGNVVAPQDMIKQLGVDGLRLWVASNDIKGDVVVSQILIENVKEVFRKIRNTCRFLISNLYDFSYEKDAVSYDSMLILDRYALAQVAEFEEKVLSFYDKQDLTGIFHAYADYCSVELSSFYLDIIKDRLYTESACGMRRRSAQTACWHILDQMTRCMAPILSVTAEQLSDLYQENKKESIHVQDFSKSPVLWKSVAKREWDLLRKVRTIVLKTIERLRVQGTVKHSLEVKVTLAMNGTKETAAEISKILHRIELSKQSKEAFLKEFFIVSQCEIIEATDIEEDAEFENTEEGDFEACESFGTDTGLLVKAGHADGKKCPRCWQWEVTDHVHGLCSRCQQIVA